MLRTAVPASYLDSDDLALLCRVLGTIHRPGDTIVDRETHAATLLRLFQSGICDEEGLTKAMTQHARVSSTGQERASFFREARCIYGPEETKAFGMAEPGGLYAKAKGG